MILLALGIIGVVMAIVLVIALGVFLFPVTGIGFILLIVWIIKKIRNKKRKQRMEVTYF